MKHTFKIVSCLSLLTISATLAHAVPVGMAARVTGKTELKVGSGWKPIRVLQRFEAGDTVRCGPGASAVVVLFDRGGRYDIGAGATATISANDVAGAKLAKAPSGASSAVAQRLAGARTGAVMARPATNYERLHAQAPAAEAKIPPPHDWLRPDERSFSVNALDSAQTYVFTLFDPKDYILFTQTITPVGGTVKVDIPEAVKLESRRAYTWRLHGFKDGRVMTRSRWGITTMLSAEDEAQLVENEKSLLTAEGKLPDDDTDLAVLADLYRSYGVLQNALEILDGEAFNAQPEIETTKGEIFAQAGVYAKALAAQAREASKALGGE
jgi:hypothetical protein